MTLTLSYGPLSSHPTSSVNFELDGPKHRILFEPFPRRVRGVLAGATVLDTVRARLLHESNLLPQLYVPEEDLRADLLEATDRSTHCPFKGDASYRSIRVGDRVSENAVWTYPEPRDGAEWLGGHAGLYWDRLDAWFDEDEQVRGHLRDPYHRVDVRRASRRVRVLAGDRVVADSSRPSVLSETGLPNRWYLPPEDVRAELRGSVKTAYCPYKGAASYWSVDLGDRVLDDAAWGYPEPLENALKATGHVCFAHDELATEVDGERVDG